MSTQTAPEQHSVPTRRTHSEIVRLFGASNLRRLLIEKGFELPNPTTTQRWADRDSIPDDYWNALAEAGVATLEELAIGADPRPAA